MRSALINRAQCGLLVILLASGCEFDDGSKKPSDTSPPPVVNVNPNPNPPAQPAAPPPPAVVSASDLLIYLPKSIRIATGVRLEGLPKVGQFEEDLRLRLLPVLRLADRAGLKQDDIKYLWAGSNRTTNQSIVLVHMKEPIDQDKLITGLSLKQDNVDKVGKAVLYDLPHQHNPKVSLAMPDPKTLLVGHEPLLREALENTSDSEFRLALNLAQFEQARCWVVGEDKGGNPSVSKAGSDPDQLTVVKQTEIATGFPSRHITVAALVPSAPPPAPPTPPADGTTDPAATSPPADTSNAPATPAPAPSAPARPATPQQLEIIFRFDTEAAAIAAERNLQVGYQAVQRIIEALKPPPPPMPNPDGTIPPAPPRPVVSLDIHGGRTALEFYSLSTGLKRTETRVRTLLNFPRGTAGILQRFTTDMSRALGVTATGNGVFDGNLQVLLQGVTKWQEDPASKLLGVTEIKDAAIHGGYSWMTELLPHLGYTSMHAQIDMTKSWAAPENRKPTSAVIPEFLNPAAPDTTWKGFPYSGMGITHFVGISGVESNRNDVAAEWDRSDPRAGIFGYKRVAKPNEVTDGASTTLMMIGSGRIRAPWVQGGGATIRGARKPYFDALSGFGSEGTPTPGAFVLMADGAAKFISADIDPEVFKALCTIGGKDKVDLQPDHLK